MLFGDKRCVWRANYGKLGDKRFAWIHANQKMAYDHEIPAKVKNNIVNKVIAAFLCEYVVIGQATGVMRITCGDDIKKRYALKVPVISLAGRSRGYLPADPASSRDGKGIRSCGEMDVGFYARKSKGRGGLTTIITEEDFRWKRRVGLKSAGG